MEGGRHSLSVAAISALPDHFVRAPALGSDQADDVPGEIWVPLLDQARWDDVWQDSTRGWAMADGAHQAALLQTAVSCYQRAVSREWFWQRITSALFLESSMHDLEAVYGQGHEGLDQLLAQVIGLARWEGEAGVIRRTTDPGVQLIDYPHRERRASPWM